MDLQKHVFSKKRLRLLYDIVSKYGMLNKVIWEINDANFETVTDMDRNLIIQLDQKWSKASIDVYTKQKNKTGLIILSNWFANFDYMDYDEIISYGHQNGFLMKCSIVNDSCIAHQLFSMGVDLIVTDCLK